MRLDGSISDDALVPVPGEFAYFVIGLPPGTSTPDPALWEAELTYAAFAQGKLPAVPVTPQVLPESSMPLPLHVRDQVEAYRREKPDWRPLTLGVPVCGVRIVEVFTDYLAIPRKLTRGRPLPELSADPAFSDLISIALDAAYPSPLSIAGVVLSDRRGVDDLPVIPADRGRRAKFGAMLDRGEIGAGVAVIGGRVVPPGS